MLLIKKNIFPISRFRVETKIHFLFDFNIHLSFFDVDQNYSLLSPIFRYSNYDKNFPKIVCSKGLCVFCYDLVGYFSKK